MSNQKYFASDREYDTELQRLQRLENRADPNSISQLEALGVGPGWKCLEIGAGAGSMARWLAERVSPGGTVVATDVNTRFLESIKIPNLTIRQHNLYTDDLEEDEYDLVHCRLVFSHLNSDKRCLAKMARALRPGGILLIHDADWSFHRAADLEHPGAEPFSRIVKLVVQAGKESGTLDTCCGANLHARLEELGFSEVASEGRLRIARGDSPAAKAFMQAASLFKPGLMSTGKVTEQDWLRLGALLEDPSFYFTTGPGFTAWGRKPQQPM